MIIRRILYHIVTCIIRSNDLYTLNQIIVSEWKCFHQNNSYMRWGRSQTWLLIGCRSECNIATRSPIYIHGLSSLSAAGVLPIQSVSSSFTSEEFLLIVLRYWLEFSFKQSKNQSNHQTNLLWNLIIGEPQDRFSNALGLKKFVKKRWEGNEEIGFMKRLFEDFILSKYKVISCSKENRIIYNNNKRYWLL